MEAYNEIPSDIPRSGWVLNRSLVIDGIPRPPFSLEQLEVLPGVVGSLKLLRRAQGFALSS